MALRGSASFNINYFCLGCGTRLGDIAKSAVYRSTYCGQDCHDRKKARDSPRKPTAHDRLAARRARKKKELMEETVKSYRVLIQTTLVVSVIVEVEDVEETGDLRGDNQLRKAMRERAREKGLQEFRNQMSDWKAAELSASVIDVEDV